MVHRHAPFRLIALAVLALVIPSEAARGAGVPQALQPLALVGNAERPDCGSPVAPFLATDVFQRVDREDGLGVFRDDPADPDEVELNAAGSEADLQPSVVLCSPTYPGIPGPIGGTTATPLSRSRVGAGWRELGAPITEPAALTPGDRLTIPEIDDAAELRLSVATAGSAPTAVARLTDLAPGPSTVAIGRDGRGLTATLTRADGSTAESVVAPVSAPRDRFTVTGTRRRWRVTTEQLPGTTVLVETLGTTIFWSLERTTAVRHTSTVRVRFSRRSSRRVRVLLAAVNRAAHWTHVSRCVVTLGRGRTPKRADCEALTLRELTAMAVDAWFSGRTSSSAWPSHAELRQALARATGRRPVAGRRDVRPPANQRRARRAGAHARAHRAAAPPLAFRPYARSAQVRRIAPSALRVLAADVNGDGAPDYWTDSARRTRALRPAAGAPAGLLLTSSPAGLTAHLVSLPDAPSEQWIDNSELSAIADVTGDGIGELVVDLGDRSAIVPGTSAWTGTTTPIPVAATTPGVTVIAPSLSSPGAPLATLDDVTGDGRAELAVGDDDGGWLSVASSLLHPGLEAVPSGARAVAAPHALSQGSVYDEARPQVPPAFRAIDGVAYALRWPVTTTGAQRTGQVTVAVHDALGRDVRPPVTVPTPGDALLLDADRATGQLLLLAYAAACQDDAAWSSHCIRTVMRVAPDGSVLQSIGTSEDLGGDDFSPSSARFAPDGPDADTDPEIAFSADAARIAVANSTARGALDPQQLPVLRVLRGWHGEHPWVGLRLVPWFGRDGRRHLLLTLPAERRTTPPGWSPGWEWDGRVLPGELTWQ